MTVTENTAGERRVHVDVEVAGTPAEVWDAIATGPGVSSWFVDTQFESRGAEPQLVRSDFGPGMQSVATITSWDPPRRFTTESADLGEGAPLVHTTWTIESRANGTCAVRVVHAVHTDRKDWDAHLAAWESGWPAFFHLLQLTLAHFRGAACATCYFSATADAADGAWQRLAAQLGLEGVSLGERFEATSAAPPLAGVVERTAEDKERVLRLERPAPGLVHLFVMPHGATSTVWLRFNYFGAAADNTLERERPAWQAWFQALFPSKSPEQPS